MGLFRPPNVARLARKGHWRGLAKALRDDDPEVRARAAEALGRGAGGADAVEAVVDVLAGEDRSEVIDAGADALRAMGEPAITPLADGLNHAREERRALYAGILARIGEPHGLPPLLDASHHEMFAMRAIVAVALGSLGSERAVDRLLEMHATDPEPTTRGYAAFALGQAGAARAVAPLIAALDSDEPTVRYGSAQALGELRDARALAPLRALIAREEDETVRRGAEDALDRLARSAAAG